MRQKTDQIAQKNEIKKIVQSIQEKNCEIGKLLNKSFKFLAFENRYTLHPRRLGELGKEEVEHFINFLQTFDEIAVFKHGSLRALEGLGQNSLLKIGTILKDFIIQQFTGQDFNFLKTALHALDLYMSSYINGFVQSLEKKILKDQEQLRLALSTALERQRKELYIKNSAIHSSNNAIMLTDMEGRITYINPAFMKIWQYENEEEILNTSSSDFWGNERADKIAASLKNKGGWQGEITSNHKDGSAFDVVVSASLILDTSSTPVGAMAFFTDITERKRLEAQLRQSQKMEALGQLAGGIIHDFNNLLTAISGYSQLQLMELPHDTRVYQDFLQIKTATDRGKDLTQELRIFTREASRKRESINLNSLIKETFTILKRAFPPEVKIELDFDQNLKMINANSSQMSQLLMNLCVNARDAIMGNADTKQGVLTLRTGNVDLDPLSASRYLNAVQGLYICLTVEDSGTGMSPAILDRIFEPFFTTKGERRGTGLGLAVVYGIVQNHKGFIDVRSIKDLGSTFRIYLPVLDEDKKTSTDNIYSPEIASGKGTVLVAEDDPQVRSMVLRTLEKAGYTVLSANNGHEAVSLYKKHKDSVDLVVLDVVMPEMGGRDCFRHLKIINPSIKIVIMTGFTSDGSVEDFLDMGAIEVVKKPFELNDFSQVVHKAISTENSALH